MEEEHTLEREIQCTKQEKGVKELIGHKIVDLEYLSFNYQRIVLFIFNYFYNRGIKN